MRIDSVNNDDGQVTCECAFDREREWSGSSALIMISKLGKDFFVVSASVHREDRLKILIRIAIKNNAVSLQKEPGRLARPLKDSFGDLQASRAFDWKAFG